MQVYLAHSPAKTTMIWHSQSLSMSRHPRQPWLCKSTGLASLCILSIILGVHALPTPLDHHHTRIFPQQKCDRCMVRSVVHQHHAAPGPDTLLSSTSQGAPPLPVLFLAESPITGVNVSDTLFAPTMQANIDYLITSCECFRSTTRMVKSIYAATLTNPHKSVSVDHMLYPFRIRAGQPNPPMGPRPQVGFWDNDLKGANAGRFLMGAGNSLRWFENETLQTMLNAVIDGVEECADGTYILPYHPSGFMHSEQGDYARSWFTQGLIEV